MKKIIAIIAAGLVSVLFIGCGPQKLNLQPNMQQVMGISKKDAVSYLNAIPSKKDCTFYEEYLTVTFVGAGKSGKYGSAGFGQTKDGNEIRIMVVLPSDHSIPNICTVYHGPSLSKAQEAVNALDKLGVIIQ